MNRVAARVSVAALAVAALLVAAGVSAQTADLRIVKTGPAEAMPGSTFSWTLQIVNDGPGAADGTTFSDPIPDGVTSVSAQCGAPNSAVCGPVTVTPVGTTYLVSGSVTSLPAHELVTITIRATAPSLVVSIVPILPPMVNVATVTPPAGVTDPNPANNQSQATTRVLQVDLVVTKRHAGAFHRGQRGATYTLVVTNGGVLPHTSFVFLTDTLPAGLTPVSMSGAGWDCTLGLPLQCISTTTIPAGASLPAVTLSVDVAANAPASVVNVAHVVGLQNSVTTNDDASDATAIALVPAVEVPTLSPAGTGALALALAAAATLLRRRR